MISYRTALCFVVTLQGMICVGSAMGQAGGAVAPLPPAFRQQTAFEPSEAKTIDTWVSSQIARLTGNDVQQRQRAREDMVAGANGSAPFADAYAQSLVKTLGPVIAQSKDFAARLNAAVVAARVAEKVANPHLAPLALQMLQDKNDGILLWGMKTAKWVIPAIYNAQGAAAKPDLVQAVTQVAMTRGSGPVVAEAYQALAPDVRLVQDANLGALAKATLPSLLQLIEARNNLYMKGVPDEPTAETAALLFLTRGPVWNTLNAQEQVSVVQQISNMIGMAAQRWQSGVRADQEHMYLMLQMAGKSLQVVANNVKAPGLGTATAGLVKVNPSIAAADVTKASDAVFAALKAVPAFQGIKEAPTVAPIAPPAAVTTSPSSGGGAAAPSAAATAGGGAVPAKATETAKSK